MPRTNKQPLAQTGAPFAAAILVASFAWWILPSLPWRWGEIAFSLFLALGLAFSGFSCLGRAKISAISITPAWRWTGRALLVSALSNLLIGPVILLGHTGLLPTTGTRMWASTAINTLEILSRLFILIGLTTWPSERAGAFARIQRALSGLIVSVSLLFVLLTALPGLVEVFIEIRSAYGPVNLTFVLDLMLVVASLAVLLSAAADLPEDLRMTLRPLPLALLVYLGILLLQNALVLGNHSYHWDSPSAWLLIASTGLLISAGRAREQSDTKMRRWLGPWYRPGFLTVPVALALVWGSWLALTRPETVSFPARALGMTLGALVLLRLYISQRELHTFNHALELRVAERTKALEESVTAMLKTQRLNMVATLGAGLAHDFHNLLTVILGTGELLILRHDAGQASDRRDLESLQSAAIRARGLTQQLMALGRQSNEPRAEGFDLAQQVQEFLPLLERMVPTTVKVLLEPALGPLPVRADPRQVEQILVNLVANARDALPKGGRIQIRTTFVEAETGPWARILVEDDGDGMEAEVLDRIFEPFYTTKSPGQGTGLGLASVKAIVESWGGRLRATSEPGQGSTFTVDLHLALRPPEA